MNVPASVMCQWVVTVFKVRTRLIQFCEYKTINLGEPGAMGEEGPDGCIGNLGKQGNPGARGDDGPMAPRGQ